MYQWVHAKAVWIKEPENKFNQFAGFYRAVETKEERKLTLYMAARSYFRVYINGELLANGPARTAEGHCRIEELHFTACGKTDVAIEVVAIDKPNKYSNDCTLEPGMLIAEIVDTETKRVLGYTGDDEFKCMELKSRRSLVETMSHSRGIVEWYDLDEHSYDWIYGKHTDGIQTEWTEITDPPTYLKRRAPYPTYSRIGFHTMYGIYDEKRSGSGKTGFVLGLAKVVNSSYYEMIPDENKFVEALAEERDKPFTGEYEVISQTEEGCGSKEKKICLTPGEAPAAIIFGNQKSELGFIEFEIEVAKDCIVDVLNTDHLHFTGVFKSNTYVTRYSLKQGKYRLITFEPKLTRYIKFVFRTKGQVIVGCPNVIDYSYPDDESCFFSCNDGELNQIYEASKRTLKFNTLDIFMDCPQRERGGWLCDSYFTSQGAWQMFGDLSVEKDFLENFMLTDGGKTWHGFFPEVYPGSKENQQEVGIPNWSFWLLAELYDYYRRSGDREFVDACQKRVAQFIEGLLALRGESGLIEGLTGQFVDWSLSNKKFSLEPINIPNNCLAVRVLEEMAQLYKEDAWQKAADEMREIIEGLDKIPAFFGGNGDSAFVENGCLRRGDCLTEAGAALEIWSGFHRKDKNYINGFVNTMGYSPKYRSNPNYGKANIFIGLIMRFDVLSRLGKAKPLVKEIKDIYLPELRDGSGTFFENYNATSGCHGANALIGAILMRDVLGLGAPSELEKKVVIRPNPGELNWARGAEKCSDGMIFMDYRADQEEHTLEISLSLPEGWSYELQVPFELENWKIEVLE